MQANGILLRGTQGDRLWVLSCGHLPGIDLLPGAFVVAHQISTAHLAEYRRILSPRRQHTRLAQGTTIGPMLSVMA